MVAWSCVYSLTFCSDLAPVSLIIRTFLAHFFHLVFECIIDVFVSLLVVLCLGQLQLRLSEVLLTVISLLFFNHPEVIIRYLRLLRRSLLIFLLIQIIIFHA